ncbi:MAG: HAMP domain-containing histidine kinase [Bacteroidota bacterium]|nr:HAMP domain-containing histidine kinase [Bacteroidota bacterium]
MKLLTRYNRANYITAAVILLASSMSYYFIIRTILLKQLDKDLKVEELEINEYVQQKHSLPNESAYRGQQIKFEAAGSEHPKRAIISSSVFNSKQQEDYPVRMLTFPIAVNGVLYKAIVMKSQVEAEDLLEVIVIVTAAIILLLLLVISFINRFLLATLWQPFEKTLQALRFFDVKKAAPIELESTDIDEFNELNASVEVMTKRISEEFETMKTFTDNASHEMQTPLAIIHSKLDILLQSSNEKQADQLQAIYNAAGRLSKLNQTLLLLTKINNEQYSSLNKLNLKNLLQDKLLQFDELMKTRNVEVSFDVEDVYININEELAEILMNNLLSNAIKHNINGGYITGQLNKKTFSITNSGAALTFDKSLIFQRFQRGGQSTGTGLGLAVVQQICESSSLKIEYSVSNNAHSFTIWL